MSDLPQYDIEQSKPKDSTNHPSQIESTVFATKSYKKLICKLA